MSQEAIVAIAVSLAGLVGMPLIEGIKRIVEATGHKLEGLPALYTTAGVSVILAGLALWITGSFAQPFTWELVGGSIASVFAIATIVYRHLANKLEVAYEKREFIRDLAAMRAEQRPPFTEQ
jgi:CO/xanthine dehydrogenase Mo-binding subunit